MLRSVVVGCGSYLPATVLSNHDLAKRVDTNDDWIVERTGIRTRHIAAEGEFTSHLGAKAAKAALDNAGLKPGDIDLLVLATTTPDDTMPSTAVKVQHAIGMTRGAAFDVAAACSGFIYGLTIADSFIRSGQAKRVMVIGAETYSRIVDWSDRSTCILFGDGAGALILEASAQKGDSGDRGILHSVICSDGQYTDMLKTSGGVSSSQAAGVVTMNGREVFRHAVQKMADSVLESLSALRLVDSDLAWVVPHQANNRILQATAKRLNIDENKVISTVHAHANTSAASIPLAICHAVAKNMFKKGDLIALPALGAGLTWGACIMRW